MKNRTNGGSAAGFKKLAVGTIAVWAALAVTAGEYHWTGAVDGRWTNPENWQERQVPGRYYNDGGEIVGNTGDIVYFGDALSGAAVTTVDFTGVYSVSNILVNGSRRYTLGTEYDSDNQYIPLEPYGVFSAAEGASTPAAIVNARMRLGTEMMATSWGGERMTIRNNSSEEFVLGKWGYATKNPESSGKGGDPGITFAGSGIIRIADEYVPGACRYSQVRFETVAPVIVDAPIKLRYLAIYGISGVSAPQEIIITANGSIEPSECSNYLYITRPTVVSGEGTLYFGVGTGYSSEGKTTEETFDADLTIESQFDYKISQGSSIPDGFEYRIWHNLGRGSLVLPGSPNCDLLQDAGYYRSTGGGKVVLGKIGAGEEYGSLGRLGFVIGNNSSIEYIGSGETTDRAIILTNTTDNASGEASLVHSGSGILTVQSPVSIAGGRTSGKLVFKGADIARGVFEGTIEDAITVAQSGTGSWVFNPQNDYAGEVIVDNGEFRIQKSLHLAKLTAAGTLATVRVASGCSVIVDALEATSSKKIDLIVENGASVAAKNFETGSTPEGVLYDGRPVTVGEGSILAAVYGENETMWKEAVSGSWSDEAKWLNGVPDIQKPAYIDMPGESYTVTVDGGSVIVTNIAMRNRGSGKTILRIKNGAVFEAQGRTHENNVMLLKEGARVEVEDATLRIADMGDQKGWPANKSALESDGGEMEFYGSAQLTAVGIKAENAVETYAHNYDTWFNFASGNFIFGGNSKYAVEKGETIDGKSTVMHNYFRPNKAGETSHTIFKEKACFDSNAFTCNIGGNGGHSILEFNLDDDAPESELGNCLQIGIGNGIGELLVNSGKVSTLGWDRMWLGTAGQDKTESNTYCSTGRVVVAKGGSLTLDCGQSANDTFVGVILGHATSCDAAPGASFRYGELKVRGTYYQKRGLTLIGGGRNGCGKFIQDDGLVRIFYGGGVTEDSSTSGEVAIGAFGGTGVYEMTGGEFQTDHFVYVGGATVEDLHRPSHVRKAVLDTWHGAKGELNISGGTFLTTKNIIVGKDGSGVLRLTGTGTLKASEIIFNQTEGQEAPRIEFTVDGNGKAGNIDSAVKLVFNAPTRVVVDVSSQQTAGKLGKVAIWRLATAPDGIKNIELELTGGDKINTTNKLILSDDGTRLYWAPYAGTVVTIR